MFFSPWRYATACAYVEGWLEATGDVRAVHGFGQWLGEPSSAWFGTIARRRYPDRMNACLDFDDEAAAVLLDDLFEALDGYLASLET
jgi:hypothetical protein